MNSPKQSPQDRFWAKVDKNGPVLVEALGRCWVWTAHIDPQGYGYFRLNGHGMAHRVAWEFEVGPIPEGMVVDHRCHNKACVNPSHLRLATYKQNSENRTGAQANSASGIRGVAWSKNRGTWHGYVKHKQVQYGKHFPTIEEAEAWVIAKRLELFTHNDMDREVSSHG